MNKESFDRINLAVYEFALAYIPRVVLTLGIFIFLFYVLKAALIRAEDGMMAALGKKTDLSRESEKRIRTLFSVFRKAVNALLAAVCALIILNIFQVNIGPVLAAAGVAGLAISFGAQSLVKDFFAGVFILIENQIRVGDVAVINGTGGLVEEINLRTVVLRDNEGTVHVFPNGNITSLANRTKDWSAALLDVGVDYKEDIDNVYAVLRDTAKAMRDDPDWGPRIIEDLEVFGLNDFGDSALVIRVRLKTRPSDQWAVGRELRRRIKLSFDKAGIGIPFPHRTMYFGDMSKPIEVVMRQAAKDES